MSERVRTNVGRWGSLLIALILLVFCLFLLGSHAAAVAAQASPPTDPRPPVPYKGVQAPPTMSTKDAAAPALRGPALQTTGAEFTGERAGASGGIAPLGQPIATTGFTLDLGQNALWGLVNPGDVVTATLTSEGIYAAAEADGVGFFWSYFWLDDGKPADIDDGDTVEVYVNGALAATLDPLPISGRMDILADEVTGSVTGLGAGTAVTVTLGDFDDMIADEPQVVTSVDAMGDLSADFAGIADLGPHTSAQIQYRDANGHAFQDSFHPSKVFRVKDWWAVEGYAMPGDVVTVTVYMTYPTDVRWSQTVQASTPKGFYGAYDDIEYNDVVEVDLGGTFLQVTASALELWPDAASDQIHGWADLATGTSVRGTIWDEFEGSYAEAMDTVDASGNFTLAFSTDLRTGHWPYVAYADGDGDEVGISTPPPHLRAYPLFSGLYAVADGPHQPVTYTVDTGGEIWTQTAWCGKLNACEMAYFDSLEPGYVLTAEFSGGGTNSMTVADVSMVPDTASESLSGQADIAGWLEVTLCQWNSGPANGCGLGGVAANPSYAISFPNLDVRDGMQLYLYHYDDTDGNRTFVSQGNMETPYFEVYPWGVGGVPPQADEHVTAYLYDADGTTLLASTDDDQDWDPWRFWFGDWQGYSIEPGHWVTLTADSGWTAGLQVPVVTVEADADSDLIWGEAPKSQVFVEHQWGDSSDGRWVPVDGYVLNRAYFGGDLQNGDRVSATYQHPNGNRVRTEFFWPQVRLNVNLGHQWIGVETVPAAAVTVTVAGKGSVTGQADGNGWFQSNDWPWDPEKPTLEPGDVITAEALSLQATVDPVGAIHAVANSATDVVTGTLQAPWFPTVTVACEVWDWNGPSIVITDVNGTDGTFVCDFGAIGWDLAPGGPSIMVRYWEPDGDMVINEARFLDLIMNVNYGHDWVEGNYEPGHTLWLTVTNDVGEVQATVELQTQEIPWWGGQTGFSTNLEGTTWLPQPPDIQEGWWVYGRLDNGQSGQVRIGTIEGTLDLDNDSIAGNIWATWFTETLNANCSVWVENGPGEGFQVEPNGGAYACDFGAMGWDLQPGQDVGVQYQEPDGDWVFNVFREPAPNMRIEKWPEGSGQAMPGGAAIFTLRYRNEGEIEATTVYLTDTLPADTTYVADTSGVAPTVGSGYVAWTLGPVGPGEERQFQLVLNNTADPGDTLHNVADIWTLYDYDYGNNHAEADVQVVEGQPDLHVSKNPNPGDPAPGQTMLWEIDYGNNGPVASGPVVLTDTLPENTSIVDWSSQNGYNLWVDHSTADQLILEAPTVPGYWGDRIYLRLLVDGGVPVGTQLTNTVEIMTDPDANPDDNRQMRDDVWVGEPRWDSLVDKNLGWARLVPGGDIEYNLHVRNNGNMATHTVLTDTLPEGTSIYQSLACEGSTCVPFPPDSIVGQVASWDLGTMDPGAWVNLNLRVDIAGDVEPGAVLNNCAEVAIDGDDGWPSDNSDCVAETVYDSGPNLRIDKHYQWNGEGQLEYTIDFWNLGTTTLYNVKITDTLPADTSFNGNQWNWFWEGIDFEQVGNQLIWTIGRLEPTWSSGLRYQVDLDGDVVGVPELCFTNAAEAPIPGDVWPADNYSSVMACNGPNLEWVDFDVYRSRVWGCARSVPITVTTALTETVYWDGCWDDGNFPDTFDPGDVVTVTAGCGFQPVVVQVPDPFTAFISSDTDRVWGQIDSLAFEPVEIDVWGVATVNVDTDANGNYEALFNDLPHGAMGDVNYRTQVDYTQVTFHRRTDSLDLVLYLDYDSDHVWGNYAPGHTLWITVTEADGVTVKGTQEVTSWNIPWWGGQAGFEIDGSAWSPGPGVDIQPFDWVFGRSDTGATAEVHVGQITGNVDSSNDTIAGTVLADWWLSAGELSLWCHPTWGPNQQDQILPNGVDLYSCSWDPATEWDLLPGDSITVQYWEPDGDAVQASFHEPAPNINLEKWPEGSGQAMPGGVVVFSIRVQNYGEATADPVIVTDTLPTNAAYVADTAPATPTFPPGQAVWDLGALEPGEQVQFLVYLQNTASAGDTVHNVADAWAPNDQDPNNNHAEADVSVTDELPDLYVNKSPDPGDPAAGQTMLWYIDYGNNGPVASGPVVLSDTIPVGTSVVDWWSEQGYDWTLLASNGQLRLEAPSIPGHWGDRLLLRLALDAGLLPGTQLTNTVEIVTDPDANIGDNRHMRNDVWISEMRWNVRVDKFFNEGTLVAGGEANYGINVRNEGNMPATTTLTDILPPGTSLREAWIWDGRSNYEASPDETSGSTLVWHLGELQPAEFRNLTLILEIDGGVEAGTVLTNCAQVSLLEEDSQPADDESCAAVAVQGPGPNLRIDKYYQWNGEGQLEYTIDFWNLGTTTLYNVKITDTLPDDTSFNGNQWNWYWENIDFAQDGNELTWTISKLEPGSNSGLRYQADLDGGLIGIQGLCFTNAAQAPIPGDVWPDDNNDQVTACTGPDVYVEKWLSEGVPEPGATLTYTLEFGNQSRSPWDGNPTFGSHITETLPTGMTFITATAPWNPDEVWQPETIDGQTIVWGWGTMWAENVWRCDLVVELDDHLADGAVLVNTIEAKGDSPNDVEPDTDNNAFDLPLTVLGPVLSVGKTYDANLVAGTTVTYTLTVTNSGNAQATGATLMDTLPTGLTYLDSDGSQVVGDVVWTLAAIAAGDTAEGWFSAQLPCQAGQAVVNNTYGVVSSDQGVEAWGSAVSLTTIAPTIQVTADHDPEPALVGQTVNFEATASTNGTALTYEWDFGEGAVSGGATETHTFDQAGTYEVSVTVTDACGFGETASTTVEVVEGGSKVYLPMVLRND